MPGSQVDRTYYENSMLASQTLSNLFLCHRLLLQNHADFNTSDVTDIKNLLLAASQQGDTVHFTRNHQQMPWVSSQTGVSILEDTATASSQLEKTLPDHPGEEIGTALKPTLL